MKQAFDQSSIRLTLQKAIQAGHFTLEDLDTPSPGIRTCTAVDRRTFPNGYKGVQFRNLLRDEVITHPEAVSTRPDPKDFAPVLPPRNTPTQPQGLPLTLDDDCPF